jgi:hypothetical protein
MVKSELYKIVVSETIFVVHRRYLFGRLRDLVSILTQYIFNNYKIDFFYNNKIDFFHNYKIDLR